MRYKIYYAKQPATSLLAVPAMDFITEVEANGLDHLFRLMNTVDLTLCFVGSSVSVGDLVVQDKSGKKYHCTALGWKEAS